MSSPEFVVVVKFSMALTMTPLEQLTREAVIDEVAHRLVNRNFDLETMIDDVSLVEVFSNGQRIAVNI